jgi:hypothetical protein
MILELAANRLIKVFFAPNHMDKHRLTIVLPQKKLQTHSYNSGPAHKEKTNAQLKKMSS